MITILAALAAIAVPVLLNQRTKASETAASSDVVNVGKVLASLGQVTQVAGSDGAVSPAITIDGQTEHKFGTAVFVAAGAQPQWCVSKVSGTGVVFAMTDSSASVYRAAHQCSRATSEPASVAEGDVLPVQNGLVLYVNPAIPDSYPGAGAQWFDLSGNNNTLTLIGAPVFSGATVTFNGVDQWATGGTGSNLDPPVMTVEVFTRATGAIPSIAHPTNIAGKGNWNCSGCHWHLGYKSSAALSFVHGVSSWTAGASLPAASFASNQWHHIVGVDDGSTVKLYVDGVLRASTPSQVVRTTNGGAFMVANNYASRRYGGQVGALRVYDRALTADEVERNFESGRAAHGM